MKSPFVNELQPNQAITTSFLVNAKEVRQKKSGELYLSLLLGDRTGELDAKMWDNVAEAMPTFERGDFIKVKGLVQIFHNKPQLTVHKVRRMDESEIDISDYFPATRRDIEEMWGEVRAAVADVADPHVKALLDAMLDDPDIAARFKRAPAAKTIHHAFIGGLLEHVASLCRLARLLAVHYPGVDYSLLTAGAILHDIGKIHELNFERAVTYSDQGQLLGHITIGIQMLAEKLRGLPDFPPRLRTLIEHMILSHHGQLEFGSPKTPLFPEALLLHYLDDMDSKYECMRALIENDRQLEGCFTTYSNSLERVALKKERYLGEDGPEAAATVAQPVSAEATAPGAEPQDRGSQFAGKLKQALQSREES